MDRIDNMIKLEFLSLSKNESFARAAAAAFIAPLDPTIEELADVRTAVSEAVTNAVIHGYRNEVGMILMELTLIGRLLRIKIEDSGCGIEDIKLAMKPFYTTGNSVERSGMGFAVMGAFMDMLNVESELNKGTIVTMEKFISSNEQQQDD
ncbi:MAG: anti-sigma F factor [Clostridia bacterium]|nr:anti-sigma F factor [Clostridia bacterium]